MIEFKKREHTRSIILHDSHSSSAVERGEHILKWQGRKMGLLEIGYHFIIDRDGMLTETRPQALIGQHCRGHDRFSIGVCLIGGSDEAGRPEDNFTPEQRSTLFILVRRLKSQYGPALTLMGHSEAMHGRNKNIHQHAERQCPSLDMSDLRNDYWTFVQSGGTFV